MPIRSVARLMLMAVLAVWVRADAEAQSSTNQVKPRRRYSDRVTMHTAPYELPDPRAKPSKPKQSEGAVPTESMLAPQTGPASKPPTVWMEPDEPPTETELEKQRQERSWLLRAIHELHETPEERATREKHERPSGWGWLADEISRRQDMQKESPEEPEDEGYPTGPEDVAAVQGETADEIILEIERQPEPGLLRNGRHEPALSGRVIEDSPPKTLLLLQPLAEEAASPRAAPAAPEPVRPPPTVPDANGPSVNWHVAESSLGTVSKPEAAPEALPRTRELLTQLRVGASDLLKPRPAEPSSVPAPMRLSSQPALRSKTFEPAGGPVLAQPPAVTPAPVPKAEELEPPPSTLPFLIRPVRIAPSR